MHEQKNIQFINLHKDQQAQTMANISQLQDMEKKLYAQIQQLALSPNTKTAAKQKILVQRINNLSQMRQAQFNSLKNTYGFLQDNVSQDRSELVSQLTVLGVVEKDLNNAKRQLNEMGNLQNSKMRMIEINTYYGKRYEAHASLMKILFLICIAILLMTIVHKKHYIPDEISNALIVIILVIGLYFFTKKILDIYWRDNMNYDEFDFGDEPDMKGPTVVQYDEKHLFGSESEIEADVKGLAGDIGLGCVDADCCTTGGLVYDKKTKRCVIKATEQNEAFVTGQLTTTTPFTNSGELTGSGGINGDIKPFNNYADSDNYTEI